MKGQRNRKARAHVASVQRKRAKRRHIIARRRSGQTTVKAEYRQHQPRHQHRGDVLRFGDWLHRMAA